jgi:hypothetical protein
MKILALVGTLIIIPLAAAADNPIPGQNFAWSENAGWINFNATGGSSSLFADHLEGYAWSENVGWIRLGTFAGGSSHTYGNTNATDWGVNRNGTTISGYAWSETAGWISFNPTSGGATIDTTTGLISGFVWGENFGWIHLRNSSPSYGLGYAPAGSPSPPAQVPTLSTWAMMLLAALLATIGWRATAA